MNYEYRFPEKSLLRALEVTEPQFKIQSRKDWFEALRVDFSEVRSTGHFAQIKRALGMKNDKIESSPNTYRKIIYSGHRGNGKSVELNRFSDDINRKDAFLSVFIDLESETNIQQLEAEDIYIVLISMLIKELEKRNISYDKDTLGDIANEWLDETEVVKELKNSFGMEAGAEVKAGWSFWKLFSAEGNLKSGFSRDNVTTKTIRRKIKNNPKPLIEKFNAALVSIRQAIRKSKEGKDLIFFIDGLEKANREVYESLFVKDVDMITNLQVHIISTVPIDTYYEILEQGNMFDFINIYLPMIRINKKSISKLKEMIYKRVDKSLIDDDALTELTKMSGGCPRILLKMVNRCFWEFPEDEHILTPELAETVIHKEGNERFRTLTAKHKEVIKSGDFNHADKIVRELLQSLTILEYNGYNPERKLNPVLERFFPDLMKRQAK